VTGIVLVSHSRALAREVVALAREMVHGKPVRIAIAAGLDDRTFGTDAVQIMQAVLAADDGDGVVVLMDLGSAVLSAELALDLLDDDVRDRVVLCPAPLVEGVVVAAVAAAGGAARDDVAAEATAALAGKHAHLGNPTPVPATGGAVPADQGAGRGEVRSATFVVTNFHGLHARPAARLVQEVRPLDAVVYLHNRTTDYGPVPASSLSKVATLGALQQHEVEVSASGSQAREALDRILALAGRGFDDDDGVRELALAAAGPGRPDPPASDVAAQSRPGADIVIPAGPGPDPSSLAPGATTSGLRGLPASPGIAVGPVRRLAVAAVEVPDARTDDPHRDWRMLRESIAEVRRGIQRVRARTARDLGDTDAALFDAHLLLLEDTALLSFVRDRIDAGQAAAPAWAAGIADTAAEFDAVDDPYIKARGADVRAVGDQVLRSMLGLATPAANISGVVVAADLTPAEAAELDPKVVQAIVLAAGSPTAHSAILARAKQIPAVVAAGRAVLDLAEGTVLAVDGRTGELVAEPDETHERAFRDRAADLERRRGAARSLAASPASTRDGVDVVVAANTASLADAHAAVDNGADAVGLVRTEFLFLDRAEPPTVDEQEVAYRAVAEALHPRRVTLRTLDVGGDKPLQYVPMSGEANPFLGMRGLRLSLARPELLTDQLRAMIRVAHDHPTSVMFPMVSNVAELLSARRVVEDVIRSEGRGTPTGLEIGIMVEVPATALKAAAFARHVDFFSVGTNDLTQYTLAAERGNEAVARIGDPFDPGVLALIGAVCRGAGTATVAVCGELAADERATGLLVGLGVHELSVAATSVPEIKQAVRALDAAQAVELAGAAILAAGPEEVRAMVTDDRERR
jgi:multiphosphoryl transfer protein